MTPAVSIVLPTFNRLHFLRPAVESVFGQTFRSWELLIADDGSDAQTLSYLRQLRSPRVMLIPLAHTGRTSVVRNAALRAATGEYVAFLDSDDLWMPDKLERQIASLESRPEREWGYTGFRMVSGSLEPLAKEVPFRPAAGRIAAELLDFRTIVVQSSVIIRRSFLRTVGLYDERLSLCSDYHLWIRCALHGAADCIDGQLAWVRRHGEHAGDDIEACRDLVLALDLLRPLIAAPALSALLERQRAIAAATLARSQATRGRRLSACSTLISSAPHAWPYRAWWRGAAAAAVRALAPAALRRALRSAHAARTPRMRAGGHESKR